MNRLFALLVFLALLPACTQEIDRTSDPIVQRSRLIGKKFQLVQPALLINDTLHPLRAISNAHAPNIVLPIGTSLAVTRLVESRNSYYAALYVSARITSGTQSGRTVDISPLFYTTQFCLNPADAEHLIWNESDLAPDLSLPEWLALLKYSDASQDDQIVAHLTENNWATRWLTARVLAELPNTASPKLRTALASLRNDPDPDVRAQAAITLILLDPDQPSAIQSALAKLSQSASTTDHVICATALARIGDPAVPQLLASLKAHPYNDHILHVFGLMGATAQKYLPDILQSCDPIAIQYYSSIDDFQRIGSAPTIRALLQANLVDIYSRDLIRALAPSSPGTGPLFLDMYHSADPQLRILAVQCLAAIPDPPPQSVDALCTAAADPDARVRFECILPALTLCTFFPSQAPTLKSAYTPLLTDPDPEVRRLSGQDLDSFVQPPVKP